MEKKPEQYADVHQETFAQANAILTSPKPSDARIREIMADANERAEVRRMAQEIVDCRTSAALEKPTDPLAPDVMNIGESDMRDEGEVVDPHQPKGGK